jgi:hypothetical protein
MKFTQSIFVIAVLLGATSVDAVKINLDGNGKDKSESKYVKELKSQTKAYTDWKTCADVIKATGMAGECSK